MRCHKCGAKLKDTYIFCVECGAEVISAQAQAEPDAAANRVWEKPSEESKRNSHSAIIAVGVVVALVIALIATCAAYFGGMDLSDREESTGVFVRFGDWLGDLFGSERTPDVQIKGSADDEFLACFEALDELYLDLSYAEYVLCEREVMRGFIGARFDDRHLAELVGVYAEIAEAEAELVIGEGDEAYIGDWFAYLRLENERLPILIELIEDYGVLPVYEAAYYRSLIKINNAELEVEEDLDAQLVGVMPLWSDRYGAYCVPYTNTTQYSFDFSYSHTYHVGDDLVYDEGEFMGVHPGETVHMILKNYPDEYDEWYVEWYVYDTYYNGIDIYEYYFD